MGKTCLLCPVQGRDAFSPRLGYAKEIGNYFTTSLFKKTRVFFGEEESPFSNKNIWERLRFRFRV